MFTQKLIKWIMAVSLLTIVAFAAHRLPGVALASDPDTVVTDANAHTSYLDSLREMGQAEARIIQARHARDVAVFDHSSYLDNLHALALMARNQPVIATANDYVTHLDQLRGLNTLSRSDTGAHISSLDRLRQAGQQATLRNSQVASR
jgi:hypothetical protein